MQELYDVIIIGGGPAGVTAGIYATRAGLSALILEEKLVGGQAGFTSIIDNYPGFPKIEGFELAEKLREHAESLGVEIVDEAVLNIDLTGNPKQVKIEGNVLKAKALILAMGARPRTLGVMGEEEFMGRGVCYCATCDGALYAGKNVVVIGGGNTAVEEAIYLSGICKHVELFHVLDDFQANNALVDSMKKNKKITWHLLSKVVSIGGEKQVEKITIEHEGVFKEYKTDAVFVAIGRAPNTEKLQRTIDLDGAGYVVTPETMATNVKGVYAAGDMRAKVLRQIVTATNDGAVAATEVAKYISSIH